MPSLSLPDKFIWFAHCPKAGGTSVEQFMVAHWGDAVGHLHWGWDLWWRRGGWRIADPPNSPQHLTWSDAQKHIPHPPDAAFAIVRDPVARMTSEHRWQRRGRRGSSVGKALAWLPFPFWLRIMLAVARRAPYAFDNHFRPQTDFVPENARVFRLEDGLDEVGGWLADVLNISEIDTQFPHAIPSGRRHPAAPSEQMVIAKTFASDYARFGYPLPEGGKAHRPLIDALATVLAPLVAWADRRGAL